MANLYQKPFIVFEGGDNVGKTTQAKLLAEYLKEKGEDVYLTFEPTKETDYGREVRVATNLTNLERTCLMIADRRWHVKKIKERLNDGYVVICDRYYWSSLAYNAECEISRQLILDSINEFALIPDLLFYLFRPELQLDNTPADGLASVLETEAKQKSALSNYSCLVKRNTAIKCFSINTEASLSKVQNILRTETLKQMLGV